MNRSIGILIGAALLAGVAVAQERQGAIAGPPAVAAAPTAPAHAEVYLISPHDGAKLRSPLTVRFGLKGMGVAPAGVKFDNTGHHHLLVDTDLAEVKLDAPLPATDKVLHFGKGQTETELKLTPGKHTLQLLFADYTHVPISPTVASKKISITVE